MIEANVHSGMSATVHLRNRSLKKVCFSNDTYKGVVLKILKYVDNFD